MVANPICRYRPALHGWAVATACLTFLLLVVGGLVTSHGAGLAVPDWPNSFGYNMFAFPVSRWVGGIFYEHTHRLIATFVGLFTAVLAAWIWMVESRKEVRWVGVAGVIAVLALLGVRKMPVYLVLATLAPVAALTFVWLAARDGGRVRWLGMAALAAVVLQGVLGGVRVVWLKNEIGIFHGMLAQAFLVFLTVLTVLLSRGFKEGRWADFAPNPALRRWVVGATALIFLQLGLGATMRHEHIGLSIHDFPLAYGRILPDTRAETMEKINAARVEANEMRISAAQIWIHLAHRFVAFGIAGVIFAVFLRARHCAPPVRGWSAVWLALVVGQIGLGAWTIWSGKAADIATLHMATGALTLLVGAVLSFRLFCAGRAWDFSLPAASNPRLMEAAA